MKVHINLSIDERPDYARNAFLLRWNPAISSYAMEDLDEDMECWAQGEWDRKFDWSVCDWQKAHKGDRFFMLCADEECGGIFAAGRFISEPYKGADWSGKGREVYYMRMEFEKVFHPERVSVIKSEELEREIPFVDWREGHSGELLSKDDAERLELLWRDFVGSNKELYLPRAVKNEEYDMRSDIDKAIELASKAHAADYDLDGNPTILHPLAVGMMGGNDNERIVGFLHDVVEDTTYTLEDIAEEGFSKEVLSALFLLTHEKCIPYMEYIEMICESGNKTAINVKINDLKHNIARGRAGGHMRCVEKHTKALAFIEAYIASEA